MKVFAANCLMFCLIGSIFAYPQGSGDGLALKCLICRGNNGYCKAGQVGESEVCGREVTNPVCYEVEGNEDGVTTNLKREGCIGLEDAKNKAKGKFGITLGDSKNKCESVEERGEIITACVCDTEDCNSKYELPEKKIEEEVADFTPPPKWEVFKTSWPLFDDQPRTLQDAKNMGWYEISNDCNSTAKFPGHRYAPPKREKPQPPPIAQFAAGPFAELEEPLPEIIVIYDKNGYIAGVHHVVTSSNRYEWVNGNQWYQTDKIEGKDVEMTTLYFVDPELICGVGRTDKDFEEQGTGNLLWLQNGPKDRDDIPVLKIPLTREEIVAQKQFFEHKCVSTMGTHWSSTLETCNTSSAIPIALLTDQAGDVNGFLIFLYGQDVKGYRYELPNEQVAPVSFKGLGCFLDYNKNRTHASMHVYLKEDPGTPAFFGDPNGPKITCP